MIIALLLILLIICMGIVVLAVLLQKKATENRQLVSQTKRSEVNLGFISEKLAPFLENFGPYNPRDLVFIGKPIDYIHFGNDTVTFIEIKSGNSRLSKSQKRIKSMILQQCVSWHEFRVGGKNAGTPVIQQQCGECNSGI